MKKNLTLLVLAIGLLLSHRTVPAYAEEIETFREEERVSILMYHFLTNDSKSPNKWKISVDAFKSDLHYLSEKGYETIFIKDLIDFVYNGKPLPDKPVVITFDDGDSSVYKYAYPLLKEYNMKAVLSIIGSPTDEYSESEKENDNTTYPNLTWRQLKELKESGLFEIQSHSYDLHKGSGVAKIGGESQEQYSARLSQDLNKMQKRIEEELGEVPTAFIFPFGKFSDQTEEILKENGFLASLSCFEKVNVVKMGEPDSLFSMGRFLRPRGINSQGVIKKFE